ncbi:MAG: type II toxin-antitoxin system RelE/ParE family toxin [Candidatus Marinimicrobia bacterium]|nr:type II toxin-antitoxin system RelE/ParE family toxin [Candidatus Neomarinimicrobiota bacterium]
MKFKVNIVSDAEEDLFDIYRYVASNDSELKAIRLIQKFEKLCYSLEKLPNRGHVPPELEEIGIFDYLEIHYKPYRIIYQIIENSVFVHCILDGRRDMEELLYRRLIR